MTQTIHPIDVVLHKRDGRVLTDDEIQAFIHAVVQRTPQKQLVTDAQIAAFLMAVFHRGLAPQELATLTSAMRYSGETFDATPSTPSPSTSTPPAASATRPPSSSPPSSPPQASPRQTPTASPPSASP
ncbi:hypothetical protein [Tunturiibacter gelidiferens]|uniref:hypothetical protein n=1 Tax=Tunturiibacter gelidiferens TaxID=3069689 RepID=UPI003D9B98D1